MRALKGWFCTAAHWEYPYPTDAEKEALAAETGLTVTQVSNWLRNERKRVWLPLKRGALAAPRRPAAAVARSPPGAAAAIATSAADRAPAASDAALRR